MPQALHTHEINVQLQLATLYLASNRIPHAVAVIQGLMETKLPRGRRMRIQLMLAEAFLKMRGKKSWDKKRERERERAREEYTTI